jgi:hypothetical protein
MSRNGKKSVRTSSKKVPRENRTECKIKASELEYRSGHLGNRRTGSGFWACCSGKSCSRSRPSRPINLVRPIGMARSSR